MRALLDINVLIALLDTDHPFHGFAAEWFGRNARHGWASCPLTQNGCLRIMSQPAYPNAVSVSVVADRLREATEHSAHRFWPDDASLLDPRSVRIANVHGPRQITDVYLLALAVLHEGRFVTFDETVPISSVHRAATKHMAVLRPVGPS